MFEVGRDIFTKGFSGGDIDVTARVRLKWFYWIFVACFVFFIGKTLFLGIEGTNRRRPATGANQWIVNRADIVDRNGDILAKNVVAGHIALRTRYVQDPDAVAQVIHELFPNEYSVARVLDMIKNKRGGYIKKYATDAQRARVKMARLPGLEVEVIQERKYPKRNLFSHIVGRVGVSGVEYEFDEYLRDNVEPLQLSLDSRIQSVFYEQLSAAIERYHALGGFGMLMNSSTGEMIAMVSLPDFDPESRSLDPRSERMFNKPMRGVYELGSVFKVFNTAMAMEHGIRKEYYVKEPFPIKDKFGRIVHRMRDVRSFKPPRPYLTVEEIMLHSCNAGSAQIALDLPYGTQQEFLHRIHIDERLSFDFGNTAKPLMPEKWGPLERATVSIGHGISVTPMHVLLGLNAMTNGGIYIYPTIRKKGFGPVQGERVLAPEISERLRNIMLRITEETTARQTRIQGIQIGGKTGTAEKHVNGKTDASKNMTVFVGVFPVNAPQYIIMVVLDEPQRTAASSMQRTAAWNAVPTTRLILDSILPLLFE